MAILWTVVPTPLQLGCRCAAPHGKFLEVFGHPIQDIAEKLVDAEMSEVLCSHVVLVRLDKVLQCIGKLEKHLGEKAPNLAGLMGQLGHLTLTEIFQRVKAGKQVGQRLATDGDGLEDVGEEHADVSSRQSSQGLFQLTDLMGCHSLHSVVQVRGVLKVNVRRHLPQFPDLLRRHAQHGILHHIDLFGEQNLLALYVDFNVSPIQVSLSKKSTMERVGKVGIFMGSQHSMGSVCSSGHGAAQEYSEDEGEGFHCCRCAQRVLEEKVCLLRGVSVESVVSVRLCCRLLLRRLLKMFRQVSSRGLSLPRGW
ncbi:hypothetical protein B0T10DRAFT_124790 [Thelonectria olida]|uniref:Uncharacterized protein n=1 Tax=Thelonectria olida TaxID=1576542 RepID=A0A9P8WEW5_9HYPO|nr:hypothetical protein B0T10DRAFT_124790 [Thelonectria olida]